MVYRWSHRYAATPIWYKNFEQKGAAYMPVFTVFGSAHVKIGVWIKAGPQPLFPAEPGVKNG